MPNLNERISLLEQMQSTHDAAQAVLAGIEPERLASVLREGIHSLERECAEGRGDELLNRPRAARSPWRTASEALPALRATLADLESEHGLAH